MIVPRFPRCLAWIGLLALLVPLVPAPVENVRWHGLRAMSVEAGGVALLLLLILPPWKAMRRNNWGEARRAVPMRFLAVLLVWGCLSALLASAKWFAWQGLLQLGTGALIVLTIAAEARERPQYEILLDALTGATLLISFSGFVLYGQDRVPLAVGLYHDHMLYGAVFTILLPLMLAVSVSPVNDARRLSAQTAFVCGVIALGLAQTRSSWIGTAVGLFVFAGLFFILRVSAPRPLLNAGEQNAGRRQLIFTGLAAVCAFGYFLLAAPDIGQLGARLSTLTTSVPQGREDSVEWRLHAWRGAAQMIAQKPTLGWGIGCYPRCQNAFTGTGNAASAVEMSGPTILDEAHNSYLQIAAEMGLPGLLLWLGVLISAFALGIPALRRFSPGGLRQRALIGCLTALAAQSVDAAANPGWQFAEVSLFLWIALGLTLALSLGVPAAGMEGEVGEIAPMGRLAVKTLPALAVAAGLLWLIFLTAPALPAPRL